MEASDTYRGRSSSGQSVSGGNVQTAALVGYGREVSFDRPDEGGRYGA
jgi:hypothetical protein